MYINSIISHKTVKIPSSYAYKAITVRKNLHTNFSSILEKPIITKKNFAEAGQIIYRYLSQLMTLAFINKLART